MPSARNRGTATSIAVTTKTPSCSGSDLSTGIEQAVAMFTSSAYTSAVPAGTARAIVISSDGESNASSNGQNSSAKWTDTELNNLAITDAQNAWKNYGISIYVVFYYHGSDSDSDTTLLQSLVQGTGTFTMTTDATTLPTALDSLFKGNMVVYGVVK